MFRSGYAAEKYLKRIDPVLVGAVGACGELHVAINVSVLGFLHCRYYLNMLKCSDLDTYIKRIDPVRVL